MYYQSITFLMVFGLSSSNFSSTTSFPLFLATSFAFLVFIIFCSNHRIFVKVSLLHFFYFVRHLLILTYQLFQNLLYDFALPYPLFSLLPSSYWRLSDNFNPNTHDIHSSLSNVYAESCFVWDYSFLTYLLLHFSPDFFLCLMGCSLPIVQSFHLALLYSFPSHTSARLYWLITITSLMTVAVII